MACAHISDAFHECCCCCRRTQNTSLHFLPSFSISEAHFPLTPGLTDIVDHRVVAVLEQQRPAKTSDQQANSKRQYTDSTQPDNVHTKTDRQTVSQLARLDQTLEVFSAIGSHCLWVVAGQTVLLCREWQWRPVVCKWFQCVLQHLGHCTLVQFGDPAAEHATTTKLSLSHRHIH